MNVDYLRVSVTEQCNLRCLYCNPLGCDRPGGGQRALLGDQIERIVRLCTDCGVRRVRLTGGEPLMREDIIDLVGNLARIPGVEDLSLTTNGVLLGPVAKLLKNAGLHRVNISLDALEPACYKRIAGKDALPAVIEAIHKAIEAGLGPVKINCVVMRRVNLSEVHALAEMSMRLPVAVRFIEYYPTSQTTEPAGGYVPNAEVRQILESRFGSLSDYALSPAGGPAVHFRIAGAVGAVGFISGRSSNFCHRCTRLRLTSDGMFKPCLHANQGYDVRRLLQAGAADEVIRRLIRQVLREKNRYTKSSSPDNEFLMQHIGG